MKRLFVGLMTGLGLSVAGWVFAQNMNLTPVTTSVFVQNNTSTLQSPTVAPVTAYGGTTVFTYPTPTTQLHHRVKKHPQVVMTPVPTPMPSHEGKAIYGGGVNPWKQESK